MPGIFTLPDTRPAPSIGLRYLVIQLGLIIPVILFVVLKPDALALLGVKFEIPLPLAMMAGFALYVILVIPLYLLQKHAGLTKHGELTSFLVLRKIWPRQKTQKILMVIALCLFNPVTEEIFYRGVAIFLFGTYVDQFLLAAVLGLVLSLVSHLYQGKGSLFFQLMFHTSAILILFSPLGLAGCIGFHVAGDAIPLLQFHRNGLRLARQLAPANSRLKRPKLRKTTSGEAQDEWASDMTKEN